MGLAEVAAAGLKIAQRTWQGIRLISELWFHWASVKCSAQYKRHRGRGQAEELQHMTTGVRVGASTALKIVSARHPGRQSYSYFVKQIIWNYAVTTFLFLFQHQSNYSISFSSPVKFHSDGRWGQRGQTFHKGLYEIALMKSCAPSMHLLTDNKAALTHLQICKPGSLT